MINAKEKIKGHFRAQQVTQNRDTPPSAANAASELDWNYDELPAATQNSFADAIRFE